MNSWIHYVEIENSVCSHCEFFFVQIVNSWSWNFEFVMNLRIQSTDLSFSKSYIHYSPSNKALRRSMIVESCMQRFNADCNFQWMSNFLLRYINDGDLKKTNKSDFLTVLYVSRKQLKHPKHNELMSEMFNIYRMFIGVMFIQDIPL
jgi:hypothetical protein